MRLTFARPLDPAGFSHADRLGSSAAELLDLQRIQRVICGGEDMFGMWREAYRVRPSPFPPHLCPSSCAEAPTLSCGPNLPQWKDFVALYSLDRSASAVGLPRRLIEHGRDRFGFLLPGGCVREPTAA